MRVNTPNDLMLDHFKLLYRKILITSYDMISRNSNLSNQNKYLQNLTYVQFLFEVPNFFFNFFSSLIFSLNFYLIGCQLMKTNVHEKKKKKTLKLYSYS